MSRSALHLVVSVALGGLVFAACSDDAPTDLLSDVPLDDASMDIATFDAGGDDAAVDAASDAAADAGDTAVDAASDPVAPDAGPGGDLCDTADDCAPGFDCVRPDVDAPVGLCTTRCLDDMDCPDGFACFVFAASGGDAERWCVPTELCLDEDEDGYGYGADCRGRDCDDSNPRINPAADEICDGLDNDCDDRIDDNPIEDNDPCETGFAGRCSPGRYSCEGGVLYCNPDGASDVESCDGLDNDCDGETDEGDICGDTCCVDDNCSGACAFGTLAAGGVCEPAPSVGAEVCDGIDNDCDGETDESDPSLDAACESAEPGICTPGLTSCIEGALICLSRIDPRAEVCNGEDDDCDGETDEGGVCAGEDCCFDDDCDGVCGTATTDDAGACVEPAAFGVESCDGLDNDCDGAVDEGGVCAGEPCCFGDDCDGVCGTARTDDRGACVEPAAFGSDLCDGLDNDCDGDVDDADPAVGDACNTGRLGVCAAGVRACEDGGLVCEPTSAARDEICNGVDDDCDGDVDEGVTTTWYRDADRDGAGSPMFGTRDACAAPAGFVASSDDCNDDDATVRPGATEAVGDGVDQNCDRRERCYRDRDDDGVRTTEVFDSADADCTDAGEALASDPTGDCNDTNPAIRPGAVEIAGDGVDQNCDERELCFGDGDRDGYHDDVADVLSADTDCSDPGEVGLGGRGGDCNDANPDIHPGRREVCNGIDDNCVDGTDEGLPFTTWYPDEDDDEYGDETAGVSSCAPVPGYISTGGDCNDDNGAVNPGVAFDFCDGVDNDCDRRADEDAPEIPIGCCCDFGPCQQGARGEDVVRVCSRGEYICEIRGDTFITDRCELVP